jgi:hypothetical protein
MFWLPANTIMPDPEFKNDAVEAARLSAKSRRKKARWPVANPSAIWSLRTNPRGRTAQRLAQTQVSRNAFGDGTTAISQPFVYILLHGAETIHRSALEVWFAPVIFE